MFKDRLRFVREQKKMTQIEFAELAHLSLSAQTNYERGLRVPDINYLEAIAKHGVDVGYLLTGIPTDLNTLSDDEKELLQNYRMINHAEQRAILMVSRSFIKKDDISDDDSEDSSGGVIKGDKFAENKNKKSKTTNFMSIAMETIFCRAKLYLVEVFLAVLFAVMGMSAINYVMQVGDSFNAPEYGWLAMTAYIAMSLFGIAVLGKFVVKRQQLLCE